MQSACECACTCRLTIALLLVGSTDSEAIGLAGTVDGGGCEEPVDCSCVSFTMMCLVASCTLSALSEVNCC